MKDSSGNIDKLVETIKAVKRGFNVLSGSGTTFWKALQSGASGGILAFANAAPYACLTIWEAFRRVNTTLRRIGRTAYSKRHG